ncbi:hypothetical protein DFP72DRAFT_586098 [Ephemerocybe angulata]|uniref:Prolyl 4-hydroxylase alpha subunit domain-containing protein n=1 Tax=Ephemerocybe angulata TaxID=980116 RepID=A0A8H6HJE4_9AGAR|nr:hypothetical protein DFP72DRAFT_586098 [Tulosesus angulatus]
MSFNLSTTPRLEATSSRIDFSSTDLADSYSGFYATVLDNIFTEEECNELIKLAGSPPHQWEPAGLGREGKVNSGFRNSDRSLVFDEEISQAIYERLYPLVPEIHEIEPTGEWCRITGKPGRTKQMPTWTCLGVNPRLSFLRYGPGHYFKPHCDGLIEIPKGQKAFVTLHLYLNERDEHGNKLEGGSTRFWTPNKKHFLDVEPKIGRVLVFQQRCLVHSGEEVTAGIKYTMRSDFMFKNNR